MKISGLGDVMNKFEVLGIVGEGKTLFFFFFVLTNLWPPAFTVLICERAF